MASFTYVPNRVIDSDGIASGAAIYIYQSGGTTPVSLFSDAGYTTPVSNPYVVNAGALVPTLHTNYAGALRVRVVTHDGEVPLDEDPYNGPLSLGDLAEATGANLIGIPGGGTLADYLGGNDTRADISALDAEGGMRVFLNEDGREGWFHFVDFDLSAEVTLDTRQGVYIAPDADPTGATGAWVRTNAGVSPDPRWFGLIVDGNIPNDGAPLFNPTTATGTDNKAAIQACINVLGGCILPKGTIAVGSMITVGQGQYLKGQSVAHCNLTPLPTFTDNAVISLEGTRATCEKINIVIPRDVYQPLDDTGTRVNGFRTWGNYFHIYMKDCRVNGGYRGFFLGAFEASLFKCNADKNYDGFYCTAWQTSPSDSGGYDQSLFNCSATDNTNYGVYSNKGFEATDLHIVRAGSRALFLQNQIPVMIAGLFVDTPRRDGVYFRDVNGAQIEKIYFTKLGEGRSFDGGTATTTGTTPDYDARYFVMERSRGNRFTGGSINIGSGISQTDLYFISIDDGVTIDEDDKSINNQFEGFRTQSIAITDNTALQKKYATWQKWLRNSGTLSRWDNEGLGYRAEPVAIGAGATATIKFYLPEIDQTATNRFATMQFHWNARSSSANRASGGGVIPVVLGADTGSKDAAITTTYSTGTAPTFTITGVTVTSSVDGNKITRYIEYTVTNTSASGITFSHLVYPILDNQPAQA